MQAFPKCFSLSTFISVMANDSPREPLLPGSLNPPERLEKKITKKKRKKFVRSRSAPSIDHSSIPVDEDHNRFPGSNLISGYLRPERLEKKQMECSMLCTSPL